jgi:hypothetical protein
MASLAQIQDWWDANVVPFVEQRLETFASFRHKDDNVPLTDVDGLADALNGKVATADLNAEATARATADTTLQSNINAEATARGSAITSEASTRANADTTLQNNINSLSASSAKYTTVATYAAMITLGTPSVLTTVKVTADENKKNTHTIYQLWPDGSRIWVAAIKEN